MLAQQRFLCHSKGMRRGAAKEMDMTCNLGCKTECKAKVHGCASECPALPWQPGMVSGQCRWIHDGDESRLVDEAGVTWQTHYRGGADTWAGSIQRHETMGDNW